MYSTAVVRVLVVRRSTGYRYGTVWLRVERLTPTVDYIRTAEVPTVDLTIVYSCLKPRYRYSSCTAQPGNTTLISSVAYTPRNLLIRLVTVPTLLHKYKLYIPRYMYMVLFSSSIPVGL